MQAGLYCKDHHLPSASAPVAGDTRRILRHRDENGVRTYRVDGASQWVSSSQLSAAALREYERFLAEKRARRKRQRGHLEQPAERHPAEDAPYFDAVEPIMNPQPDDVNICEPVRH